MGDKRMTERNFKMSLNYSYSNPVPTNVEFQFSFKDYVKLLLHSNWAAKRYYPGGKGAINIKSYPHPHKFMKISYKTPFQLSALYERTIYKARAN